MQMRDGLPAMCSGVDHQPVAMFGNTLLLCQCFRHLNHVPYQRLIAGFQRIDRVDVPVGNDENVRAGNRVDIAKCSHLLIMIDDIGRSFSGEDFAKDAGHKSDQLSAIRGQGMAPYAG